MMIATKRSSAPVCNSGFALMWAWLPLLLTPWMLSCTVLIPFKFADGFMILNVSGI